MQAWQNWRTSQLFGELDTCPKIEIYSELWVVMEHLIFTNTTILQADP